MDGIDDVLKKLAIKLAINHFLESEEGSNERKTQVYLFIKFMHEQTEGKVNSEQAERLISATCEDDISEVIAEINDFQDINSTA